LYEWQHKDSYITIKRNDKFLSVTYFIILFSFINKKNYLVMLHGVIVCTELEAIRFYFIPFIHNGELKQTRIQHTTLMSVIIKKKLFTTAAA
jgi:hypothetical protein